MTNFEKELLAQLRNGATGDTLLSLVQNAEKAYQKEQEEEKKKAEAEAKKAAEMADAKFITDLANRALTNQTTTEDIAWLFRRHFSTKWNKNKAILDQIMTAEEIEQMINTAAQMMKSLDGFLQLMGCSWDELSDDLVEMLNIEKSKSKSKKTTDCGTSDDVAIRSFIDKICR